MLRTPARARTAARTTTPRVVTGPPVRLARHPRGNGPREARYSPAGVPDSRLHTDDGQLSLGLRLRDTSTDPLTRLERVLVSRVVAILEIVCGRRAPRQLEDLASTVTARRLTTRLARTGPLSGAPRLASVHSCISSSTAELSGTVTRGGRVEAWAARLDHTERGDWLCTDFHVLHTAR